MVIERVILSCEHAGALVPSRYASLFRTTRAVRALRSHRGLDLGARVLARALSRRFGWPIYLCRTTRLLVDVNRSVGHRRLFSEFVARLGRADRRRVLALYHTPYRDRLDAAVAGAIRRGGPVLHLSVHTFTPSLNGEARQADVGFLYDPARPLEREWCRAWKASLAVTAPNLRARRNYPYRGTADGLTTLLRSRFRPGDYVGIELEVNQRLVAEPGEARSSCIRSLSDSLATITGRASWTSRRGGIIAVARGAPPPPDRAVATPVPP